MGKALNMSCRADRRKTTIDTIVVDECMKARWLGIGASARPACRVLLTRRSCTICTPLPQCMRLPHCCLPAAGSVQSHPHILGPAWLHQPLSSCHPACPSALTHSSVFLIAHLFAHSRYHHRPIHQDFAHQQLLHPLVRHPPSTIHRCETCLPDTAQTFQLPLLSDVP